MSRRPVPLMARLMAKVRRDASGCWIFTGRLNNAGYGRIWSGPSGTVVYSHRAAYKLLVGVIPEGLELDHLCQNPACCNPVHLEPVTHKTNTLRSGAPMAHNASKVTCSRGHALDDANAHLATNGRRRCRTCDRENARKYREKASA